MNQYRADALPHELVCCLQNLFSDSCKLCNQTYCIKLGEKPILSCIKCGQGCHNSCVLQVIGITEADLDEDNNFGQHVANPFSTLGLFYVCHYCQNEIIPQKNTLRVRSGSHRNSVSQNSTENTVVNVDPPEISVDNEDAGNSTLHPTGQQNPTDSGTTTTNNATNVPEITNSNQDQPQVIQRPICKFFKTGRCKHGISGKKDGICTYRHPKICNKLLKNGLRRRGGCNRGDSCDFFHPKMCNSSLQERVCLRENCKFMHISGTRRTEHPNPPNVTNEYQNVSSEQPSRNSGRTTPNPRRATPNPRRATPNQSNRDLPTSTVPAETIVF